MKGKAMIERIMKGIMRRKIAIAVLAFVFISVLIMLAVKAQSSPVQYYSPSPLSYYSSSIETYWPAYGKENCLARQDFLVQILPGSCSPAVLRTDLLEEQDVPVFCQLTGIKINPLIEVPEITSISFKGQLQKEIAGIGFHPARAALKTWGSQLLGSPVINNLGYLVVVVRRQPAENATPNWIEANLTALIQYNAEKALGIGKAGFLLPVLSDDEWQQYYKQYSFWNGKAYIRALEIGKDSAGDYARLAIYLDANKQLTSFILHAGQTSQEIYLPGYYCSAALKVNLNNIATPDIKAKIRIDDDEMWLAKGQRFLDDNCFVKDIQPNIVGGGKITISCKDSGSYTLEIDPPTARISITDAAKHESSDDFKVSKELVDGKNIYLGYIGSTDNAISSELKQLNQDFIVIVKPKELTADYFDKFNTIINSILKGKKYSLFNLFKKGGIQFGEAVKCLTGCDNSLEKGLKAYLNDKDEKSFQIISTSGTGQGTSVWGYHFTFEKVVGSVEKNYNSEESGFGKLLEKYFKEAESAYAKVADYYGDEKKLEGGGEPYGVEALHYAAALAGELKKFKTQEELLNRIIKDYPDSGFAETAKQELDLIKIQDRSKASSYINTVGTTYYTILEDIKEPGLEDKSVDLLADEKTESYRENEIVKGTLSVASIFDSYVEFSYQNKEGNQKSLKVEEGKQISLYVRDAQADKEIKVDLRVNKINLKKEASLTLTPAIMQAQTQTNFTFKIGIEKRAIKLSPEKTQELINELNDSIAQWEKVVNNLGNLVKTWKGTCFAGSAYLVVKNFINNLGGGTGMARTEAMKHWKTICKGEIAEAQKQGRTMKSSECYYKHADEIDSSVGVIKGVYESTNKEIEAIKAKKDVLQKNSVGIFNEQYLNESACIAASQEYINKYDATFQAGDKAGSDSFKSSEIFSKDNLEMLRENSRIYCNDVKDILSNIKLQEECSAGGAFATQKYEQFCKQLSTTLYTDMKQWKTTTGELQESAKITDMFKEAGIENFKITSVGGGKGVEVYKESIISKDDYSKVEGLSKVNVKGSQTVVGLRIEGVSYLAVVNSVGGIENLYELKTSVVYDEKAQVAKEKPSITGGEITGEDKRKILGKLGGDYIKIIKSGEYSNAYKNQEVKFWETGAYKGYPAVLPLGKYADEGWYVATEPYSLGTQATKAYTEAAQVMSYWICNVNGNNLEEWETAGHGDDSHCFQFNMQTGMSETTYTSIPNSADMIKLARQSLLEAAKQYGKKGYIRVGDKQFPVGKPAVTIPQYECEDFMSPTDCHLMFNLCDPVLCPSSRCDYGGRYPVADVVQTGVIGSLALCLPNAKEGILVPICLTGVHAGLDNFVQIMKAARDCLQENLKTGRNVGICDQIKSIYLCEFFWKQAAPLAKVGIPWLLESVSGKSHRGGGEYLFVQDAWDKAQQSVDYFTNYYSVNAFKAFQARSIESAGTEVCKAWVSANYPSTADMFDKLLEPESPTQFYATLSETTLTEATVPPTSHYKVYFRIYAGKDEGVYYNLYLRGQQQTGYYSLPGEMQVPNAVGYIPIGEQVDRSTDFTGPSGYKELCVRINSQEQCGFGQVTTSFAVTELKDSYLAQQATQPITKESECIEGKASLTAATLNLNLQAGVSEAIQPAIYKRGIIRVCSADNPAATTDRERWREVGNCGDKKIICWLDTVSLNQSITDRGILTETLDKAKELAKEIGKEDILYPDEAKSQLNTMENGDGIKKGEVQEAIEKLGKIKLTDADTVDDKIQEVISPVIEKYGEIIYKAIANQDKARAQFGIAGIYDRITRLIYDNKVKKAEVGEEKTGVETNNLDKSNELTIKFSEGESKSITFEGKKYSISVDFSEFSEKDRISISLDPALVFQHCSSEKGDEFSYNLDGKGADDVNVQCVGIVKVATATQEPFVSLKFKRISSIKEKKCSDCNRLFSSCSIDECQDMGDCYVNYKTGVLGGKYECLDCNAKLPYKPLCSDFNTPEECENNKCDVTGCGWVNGECQIKVEAEEKNLAQIKTTAEQCAKCRSGLDIICGREECHNLGNCYIKIVGIMSQCINCGDKTECSDFGSFEECKFNKCNLDCGWTSSGCISIGEKKNLAESSNYDEATLNYVYYNAIEKAKLLGSNEASNEVLNILQDYNTNKISKEEAILSLEMQGISKAKAENAINQIKIVLQGGLPVGNYQRPIGTAIIEDNWADYSYSASDFQNAKSESNFESRKNLYILVDKYAKQYDVNFNIIRAIIDAESNWNPSIPPSPTGAVGLMQLKDTAISDMKDKTGACAKSMGAISINKYNTEQNINGGTRYLVCQLDRFGNLNLAIAAYKAGPTAVARNCNEGIWSKCKDEFRQNDAEYPDKIKTAYNDILAASQFRTAVAEVSTNKPLGNKIIVLDPGHGGSDPGAVGNGLLEKDITLDIALRTKLYLEDKVGCSDCVKLTRDGDYYVSLADRVKFANELFPLPVYFISIHVNSAEKCPEDGGVETDHYSSSEKGKELALNIQDKISTYILSLYDRGIKTADQLYVIKNTRMPSVIVETAFICNKNDAALLKDENKRNLYAGAIGEAISELV